MTLKYAYTVVMFYIIQIMYLNYWLVGQFNQSPNSQNNSTNCNTHEQVNSTDNHQLSKQSNQLHFDFNST
jgi:hypothetical protein